MRLPRILCIDFDGTIADTDFPEINGIYPDAKKYVNKLYEEGYYIIVWTCRTSIHELEAEAWLFDNGIKFHKINDTNPHSELVFGDPVKEGKKVFADCYIDNMNVFGMKPWSEIYDWVKENVKLGEGVEIKTN